MKKFFKNILGLSYKVSFFDIDIYIHFSIIFGFFFFYVVLKGMMPALEIFIFTFLSYLSLFLHEFAHFYYVKKYNVPYEKMYIHFLGATLALKEEIKDPRIEIIVALEGPLMSVFLSFVFINLYYFTGYQLFNYLAIINFFYLIVNLIPIYPLDGGRVLEGLLSYLISRKKAHNFVKVLTFVSGVSLIGYSIYLSVEEEYTAFVKYYFVGLFLLSFIMEDIAIWLKEIKLKILKN